MTTTLERPVLSPAPAPAAASRSWHRPALFALLGGTALLYLWNLSASGWANDFYAAAAQAGSMSWKAWFFGALDPGNAITVDKPPAALWVMGLSGRIFGFSSWSLLAPQALEGVAAVAFLYAAVKRWSGPAAGLLAGAVLALTPAAALMFRFDNPDALLVLLMTAGAYCVVRALERASARWLALAGAAIGFAFLTKMLQGFLVLPGFALAYVVAAPTVLWRRLWHLLLAFWAMLAAAGWWVLAVALWPASARPYIGGSTNNSVLELVFGYNGLARLTGGQGNGGGGGGGAAGSSFGGATGLGRLFSSEMGVEISWLLPTAVLSIWAALWATRHTPRTGRVRASVLLWTGWLVVTAVVFSYMQGTIHPYYTVALAPAIGALIGIAAGELWTVRHTWAARGFYAGMIALAALWSALLLGRTSWHPELRVAILVVGLAAAIGLALPPALVGRRALAVLLLAGTLAGLGGTAAYAVTTAASPHTGSIPSVGPSSASGQGGGSGTASSDVVTLLQATTTRWAAATNGSQSAATLQLSSGASVMAIGGFTGSDPSPTLAEFEAYVQSGQISYYISGGQGGGGGRGGDSDIATWVAANYTATTVGGYTVYDLTA